MWIGVLKTLNLTLVAGGSTGLGIGVFNTPNLGGRRFHRNGVVVCSTHQPLVAGESTGLGVGVKAAQNYRGNPSNRLHFRAVLRFWGWGSKFGVWCSRFWAWGSGFAA